MVSVLSHTKHIQRRPDLYTGGSTKDYHGLIWDLISDPYIVSEFIVDNTSLKLVMELIHNAVDNTSDSIRVKFSEYNSDTVVTVTNSCRWKVTDNHTLFDKVDSYRTLDLISGYMNSGSNHDDNSYNTGMFGIGLKVVIALASKTELTLSDNTTCHHKVFIKGNMTSDTETSQCQGPATFKVKVWLKTSKQDLIRLVMGQTIELLSCKQNAPHISVQDNGSTYTLPILSPEYLAKLHLNTSSLETITFIMKQSNMVCFVGYSDADHICFINGLPSRSGTWLDIVATELRKRFRDKYKSTEFKHIKILSYIKVCCFLNIKSKGYNSNDKDKFSIKLKLVEVEGELSTSFFKQLITLQKTRRLNARLKGTSIDSIAEYRPATDTTCNLWIFEGQSAMTGFMHIINYRSEGSFCLRGKIANITKTISRIESSKTILGLLKVLGLEFTENSRSNPNLTYSQINIACDPDPDGSHIVGLLINMLSYWPSILGCVSVLIMPLYKTIDGYSFDLPQSKVLKFFKGLGSFSPSDIEELVRDHRDLYMFHLEDRSRYQKLFKIFFDKSPAERRLMFEASHTRPSMSSDKLTYKFLVLAMLRDYFIMSCDRAIPRVDGLKDVQRKIIHVAMSLRENITVLSLAGRVIDKVHYHHGDASLHRSIIKIAQVYPCSNWLGLLHPIGMFGSRTELGRDAAQARYISIDHKSLVKNIFRPEHRCVLEFNQESSKILEPKMMSPLFPLLLINPSKGIAVGYQCNLPPADPIKVLQYFIDGADGVDAVNGGLPPIEYPGFKGHYKYKSKYHWTYGCAHFKIVSDNLFVRITEIPPIYSINRFVLKLKEIIEPNKIFNYSSANDVDIRLLLQEDIESCADMPRSIWDVAGYDSIKQLLCAKITPSYLILHEDYIKKFSSREELFKFFKDSALTWQDQFRLKKIFLIDQEIIHIRSETWMLQELMAVRFQEIDEDSYLLDRHAKLGVTDLILIKLTVTTRMLTTLYLDGLAMKIRTLQKERQYWEQSADVLWRDYLQDCLRVIINSRA